MLSTENILYHVFRFYRGNINNYFGSDSKRLVEPLVRRRLTNPITRNQACYHLEKSGGQSVWLWFEAYHAPN